MMGETNSSVLRFCLRRILALLLLLMVTTSLLRVVIRMVSFIFLRLDLLSYNLVVRNTQLRVSGTGANLD